MITIPGKPLGKQRARTLKSGRSYTPDQTVNYETYVKMCYVEQGGRNLGGTDLLWMEIAAFYPIPKSTSKKKAALMEGGEIRPTVKPDLDNCIKIVADSLNGIAYKDDSQIVSVVANKFYSDAPRLEIKIGITTAKTQRYPLV